MVRKMMRPWEVETKAKRPAAPKLRAAAPRPAPPAPKVDKEIEEIIEVIKSGEHEDE